MGVTFGAPAHGSDDYKLTAPEAVNFVFNTASLKDFSSLSLNEKILLLESTYVEKGKTSVSVKMNGYVREIPILSYLVASGHEDVAIYFVINNMLSPTELFMYNNTELNAIILAFEKGLWRFIQASEGRIGDVNAPFNYNGEVGFSLLHLAAANESLHTSKMVALLLEKGANENLQTKNGYTPLDVSAIAKNRAFSEAIFLYRSDVLSDDTLLVVNTGLNRADMLIESEILKNIADGKLNSIASDYGKMNARWIKLVQKGYNRAATKFHEKMIQHADYDINMPDKAGLNALVAASISDVAGGNVEYAQFLLANGANGEYKVRGHSIPSMAVRRDNYKILNLFLQRGFSLGDMSPEGDMLAVEIVKIKPLPVKSIHVLKAYLKMLGVGN
jgi:ankyrin repeat protein